MTAADAPGRSVLARRVGAVAVGTAIDGAGLLAAFVIIGRLLGPGSFGAFSIAHSGITLAFLATEFGLASALTRGLAEDFRRARRLVGTALGLRLTSGLGVGTLLVAFAATFSSSEMTRVVLLLAMSTAAWQTSQIYVSALRAEGMMASGVSIAVIDRAVLLLTL
ncbi:MAG: hypothetical protein M3R55_14205, partial [Acidobacteriota bacterium]|nr:hypothetical protein [Acidobacteriota bacterium]